MLQILRVFAADGYTCTFEDKWRHKPFKLPFRILDIGQFVYGQVEKYKKCLERAINKDKRVPYTCINNFTLSHEVLVSGPGAVSLAGGGHSAAVWAQRGVAHHLTHLYQQAVRAARHAGPGPRHQPRPAEGWLAKTLKSPSLMAFPSPSQIHV